MKIFTVPDWEFDHLKNGGHICVNVSWRFNTSHKVYNEAKSEFILCYVTQKGGIATKSAAIRKVK